MYKAVFMPNFKFSSVKKIVALLLFAVLVSALAPFGVWGDDETVSEYRKGKIYLTYDLPEGTELEINGVRYVPVASDEKSCTLNYTVSGIDTSGSKFYINGTELGAIKSSGSFELTADMLADGENEIQARLITGGGPVYDESMVYGKYNLDDITINSLTVTGAAGNNLALTLIKYMPVAGESGVSAKETAYDGNAVAIGDGWDASTGLGGSTPGTPVMAGFRFDILQNSEGLIYEVDTVKIPDGMAEVKFFDPATQTYLDKTDTVAINNRAPKVVFPAENGTVMYKSETANISVIDNISGVKSAQIYLDDEKVKTLCAAGEYALDISGCKPGRHTVYVVSSDKSGNTEYSFFFFNAAEKPVVPPVVSGNTVSAGEGEKVYGVNLVKNINMYVNPMGDFKNTALRNSYEELVQFSDLGDITTTAAGNSLPYQSFLVDVSGLTGEAVISCFAVTGDYSAYCAAAWNYKTFAWEVLGRAESGEGITVKADISVYSKDGKLRVNLYPSVRGNGADTMLWFTDTQYYTRYDDLNILYKSIAEYAADEYAAGNIAYAVFTGDFIDQMNTAEEADKEYGVADTMQKIMDDSGLPNGVLAGNHDVSHTTFQYDYFKKYFPASRYDDHDWYGGSLDNNTNHFDLVTVGGYNFVVLCLGYGREADEKTVAWANSVLSMYSDYNAVIATHEYLLSSGVWSAETSKAIWEKIAVPNKNVKMILCGHNENSCNQIREVEDTVNGRYVLEIMHNYQFAEINQGPKHIENNYTCDGEGFLRLMTFTEAGQMVMSALSPYYGLTNYYAPYDDKFIYTLDLNRENRSITAKSFVVGVNSAETSRTDGFDGFYAVAGGKCSAITAVGYTSNYYVLSGEKPEYVINRETFGTPWYSGIAPTLSRSAASAAPSEGEARMATSLLPTDSAKLKKTSGSVNFTAEAGENGVTLKFTGTDSTWISVTAPCERISLYDNPYIYFSVNAKNSAKWNISVNTTAGKTYYFAQLLYKEFGYADYAVPSDIIGPWHGYIDISGLVKEGETVNSIYLVNASRDETVVFDYLFIGAPEGVSATFVVDDNTKRRVNITAGGTITEPEAPFAAGKVFEGWFDENNEKAVFPLTLDTNKTYQAKFTEKSSVIGCIYYQEETTFAEITENPENERSNEISVADGGLIEKYWILAICALLIFIAAVFILVKKHKK